MLCLSRPRACAGLQRCGGTVPARTFRSRVVARSANSGNGGAPPKHDASKYYSYIQGELKEARDLKENLVISDVVSNNGELQWVDLVLAGGGLLGIAHVGFVCVLEEAGVRFRGIGGTSAGAINAIIVAATRADPTQESWRETLEILSAAEFEEFQDGEGVENCNALLKLALGASGDAKPSKLGMAWAVAKTLPELPHIWKNRGLHPGDKFEAWVKEQLTDKGITDVAGLHARMSLDKSGLQIREGVLCSAEELAEISRATLKLVASDVTTQTKVVFPDMADLYYANPGQQHPSGFVRASMSVPLFFQPYEIANLKDIRALQSVQDAWGETGYPDNDDTDVAAIKAARLAAIPNKATFVDGGTLSNFPISLFDRKGVPRLPTVGCQLGKARAEPQTAADPIELYKAMNNTSRNIGDYDYVIKNPMYKPLVAVADTRGFGWLDFDMPEPQKLELFKRGAAAGVKLLKRFQKSHAADGTPNDSWTKIKRARAGVVSAPAQH
ncbi:hypothetical protein OEZ86_014091 [Tetradesmus obliquus]|nr:hypothetical protein OEZ86_014091 [Tetradesmus obliquus]